MDITLDELVIDGNEVFDFIEYALQFNNLKDIEFRNCNFTEEDLKTLIDFKNYDRVAFIECTFKNEEIMKYLKTKSLSISNSIIKNYDFIYDMFALEHLTIVNGKIDLKRINELYNLEYLRISNCYVLNENDLNITKLKYLFIDNTNIIDISFVKKLSNLELLSISEEQENNNKDFISTIQNIKIIRDSILEMEVTANE